MATIKVTFENDFHGTEATINATIRGRRLICTQTQKDRMERKLCGISDCSCQKPILESLGNPWDGPCEWEIQPTTAQAEQIAKCGS